MAAGVEPARSVSSTIPRSEDRTVGRTFAHLATHHGLAVVAHVPELTITAVDYQQGCGLACQMSAIGDCLILGGEKRSSEVLSLDLYTPCSVLGDDVYIVCTGSYRSCCSNVHLFGFPSISEGKVYQFVLTCVNIQLGPPKRMSGPVAARALSVRKQDAQAWVILQRTSIAQVRPSVLRISLLSDADLPLGRLHGRGSAEPAFGSVRIP